MISRRFDRFVEEHFKTRKWTLDTMQIGRKIGENGAIEMEIVNYDGKALSFPQNPLPNKVIGFRSIWICFIDQNVITFLRRFHRLFSFCSTTLSIHTENVHILEFIVLDIWPMLKDTIHWMDLKSITFRQMRQLAPSMLTDCTSLDFFILCNGIFSEFPPDDSADASEGQAVAKWLFTPRHDNFPKELRSYMDSTMEEQWSAIMEQIKAAFSAASSPVSFGISVLIPPSSSLSSVVPFKLTNEFTQEKLTLSKEEENGVDLNGFSLIRCPIVPDDKRQQQMINELYDRWNRIDFFFGDDGVGDGLLDGSPGPIGDH